MLVMCMGVISAPPSRVSGCYIYRSILWQDVNRASIAIARIRDVLFIAFCTTTMLFRTLPNRCRDDLCKLDIRHSVCITDPTLDK